MLHFPDYQKTVYLPAPPSFVWQYLNDSGLMQEWMAEPEVQLEIKSTFEPGTPFILQGKHPTPFVVRGKIIESIHEKKLSFTHLSSISKLADIPEHYAFFTFTLYAREKYTELELRITNFVTESIYKHLVFYWNANLELFALFIASKYKAPL